MIPTMTFQKKQSMEQEKNQWLPRGKGWGLHDEEPVGGADFQQ